MAEKKKRVRNASTGRNYGPDLKYEAKPEQKKRRAQRNAARAKMIKEGKAHKGDNVDIDHIHSVSGGNGKDNLRALPKSKNRSFNRNSDGSVKSRKK